ncbi:NAD(P)-binding Rossmann-fold superfamily protein [Actinidia rufa]|uniref:NAD(P)-binding Rossmann-fold superfamily protein n=1 Tax=Actinidia rufa TaxID=165716 RepID=A0A7J0ETQ9_9ERIC|nr:NAD(P)-binding Rossmann-fold superfamily protein [Actinidia rufa]
MELCGATTFSPSLHFPQPFPENQMTVSVTGATDNHRVCVLTRSRSEAQLIFPVRDFPGIVIAEEAEWKGCIQGSNAVVNLAGMPISTRWSPEVVDLINDSPDEIRPSVLVSATAVGYYGSSETQVFNEQSPSGNDYLAEVCREWEATALGVNKNVRLALIRIGVVLGKDGGALGVINGTAPNPVRLGEMCEQLGSVLGRPSWLPVPDLALKAVLGEEFAKSRSSQVLEGQKVLPARAKELGFTFRYTYVKDALRAIMSQ